MNIKTIVRRALDKMQGKPHKADLVDANAFLKSRLEKPLAPHTYLGSNIVGTSTVSIAPLQYTTVNTSQGFTAQNQPYTVGAITASTPPVGSIYSINNASGTAGWSQPNFAFNTSSNTSTIAFYNFANKEIVRLNKDGTVTWADEINIDDAAAAFGRAIQLGGEISSGITYGVKQRMRDSMFAEMIEMANTKGSLTADDLTYLHQAAKIMDKLQGIK